jgi:hypothetical protein
MLDDTGSEPPKGLQKPARDWIRILSKYRKPSTKLAVTHKFGYSISPICYPPTIAR